MISERWTRLRLQMLTSKRRHRTALNSWKDHMNGSIKKYIVPVRLRGSIWLRQGVATDTTLHSARLRAPISKPAIRQQPFSIATLIKELRQDVVQFPLTVVIHGWGSDAAFDFYKELGRELHDQDALWLVPADEKTLQTQLPIIQKAMVLQLDRQIDYYTYMNLVGDLVFFSATEAIELGYVPLFRQRARVLISYSGGEYNEHLIRAATNQGLTIYSLTKGKTQTVLTAPEVPATEPAESEQDVLMKAKLAQMLKEMAEHLENEYDRRPRFRAELVKVLETYPGRPNWNQDFIELGDKHQWPLWTIESLPFVHVPLEELTDGREAMLIWRRALDCAPEKLEYEVATKLWQEQFFKIYMAPEAAGIILTIAQIFEDNLSSFPFPSDRSFAGAINNAMAQIEVFLGPNYPDAAANIREMRKGILKREHVIPLESPGSLTD